MQGPADRWGHRPAEGGPAPDPDPHHRDREGHPRPLAEGAGPRRGLPADRPAKGTCPALLPLATGDVAYARTINEGLVAAQEQGAKAAGGEFVDLYPATAGHDICADHPWINGRYTDAKRALAFHPFETEQKKAAQLVLKTLDHRNAG